jgi:hypothetical protein
MRYEFWTSSALVPNYFDPEKRILAGAPETVSARLYRQLARLESSAEGVHITAYEFARREYETLSKAVCLRTANRAIMEVEGYC